MLGPRAGIFVWWLLQPNRWAATFDGFLVPALGFAFAPWTTLMYVAVFPAGINGWDWLLLGIGVVADVAGYAGGGLSARSRQTAVTY